MSSITADEIVTVVEYFGAAWPWAEWSEQTMAVWIDGLADPRLNVDGEIALTVARACVKKWERPGSMAEFLAEYRNEAERQKPDLPALPEPAVNRDRRAELMAMMRDRLANQRPHDHHRGWENCPTCVDAVKRDGLTPPPSRYAIAQALAPGAAAMQQGRN